MYIIYRGRTSIPSYSDLLRIEREEKGACETDERGVCTRNETEVKEVSERDEREGEKKEKEVCPIIDEREDHNAVLEQEMYVCA